MNCIEDSMYNDNDTSSRIEQKLNRTEFLPLQHIQIDVQMYRCMEE